MKNEKLYEKYAQEGWPCGFMSCAACDIYNGMVKLFCKLRRKGAESLALWQELFRAFALLLFFGPFDLIMFKVEDWQFKREEKKKELMRKK